VTKTTVTLRGLVTQWPRLSKEATTALPDLPTHPGTHVSALRAPTCPLC
jgi:hypothetical protein